MRSTKPSQTIAATLAFIGGLFSVSTSAADFNAQGHDTPAYIDLEFSEIRVNEPAGTVSVNIIRTGEYRQVTTIEYQTEGDTASEGEDYKGLGGTLTFRPGEGFKTITVQILTDENAEPTESFRFAITGAGANTMIMRSSAKIVIADAPVPITPPRLEILSAGNGNILLSWQGSDRCALERTTNPASGNWEPVACTPTMAGSRCQVTQPCGGALFFYRLRMP
jgi:hypothetical protein